MSLKKHNRKILLGCVAASLFLHVSALGFWHRYSLWFPSVQKIQEAADWISMIGKQERDEVLKTAFETVRQEPSTQATYQPQAEEIASLQTTLSMPEHPANKALFEAPMWPLQELAASNPTLPTFSLPSDPFNLLEHLPKDLMVPQSSKPFAPTFSPVAVTSAVTLTSRTAVIEEAPKTSIVYPDPKHLAMIDPPDMVKAPNTIALPDLPKLPTLDELDTSSYSDSFDAELVFVPREEGDGYIFALTLIPREHLELPRIRQNLTFLIDRSNSIQQGRLSAAKAAVHRALEELNPEDTFNIIAFDSKMEKMSPSALPCSKRSFATAEAFLEKIQLGSFFTGADLSRPLFLTVPGRVDNDETYTAILLTDGESLGKKNAQQTLVGDWTRFNQGKVALYVLSMDDTHSSVLETATTLNKGKLTTATGTRAIKRKLLKLMKNIQTPIAKNISCKAISRLPQTKVQLLSKATQMPHLYLDQPYVILGEAESLDDFILFVQGRLKGRWINIKKTISFINAKKGNKSLRQEWAMQRAFHLYERYLVEQDVRHLADAKILLEPFDLPVAFQ